MLRHSVALAASVAALVLIAGPASVPAKDYEGATTVKGHYKGKNSAGRAMSFDVVGRPSKRKIRNFAVDVDTECWNDFNHDGQSDRLLAHITGFKARLKKNGSFEIYYAPDDDTEFQFSGRVADGRAKVNVIVGGTFDADGTPDLAGPYQCDSWGAKYRARTKR
jgi:hypothetical protein